MGRRLGSKNRPKGDAIEVEEEEVEQIESTKNIVKGWITINIAPKTSFKSKAYYTGADIHETREDAMRVTASNRVGIAYIECEVKE